MNAIAFLDTEFTSFERPQLLSIGLVTMDGSEFYAEMDLDTEVGRAREMASSDFVRFGGVLDMWRHVPGATCNASQMSERLGRWLLDLTTRSVGVPVQIAFDFHVDFYLMRSALHASEFWKAVRGSLTPLYVYPDTGSTAAEVAADACYRDLAVRGFGKHHALADAWALRAAYVDGSLLSASRNGGSNDHA